MVPPLGLGMANGTNLVDSSRLSGESETLFVVGQMRGIKRNRLNPSRSGSNETNQKFEERIRSLGWIRTRRAGPVSYLSIIIILRNSNFSLIIKINVRIVTVPDFYKSQLT